MRKTAFIVAIGITALTNAQFTGGNLVVRIVGDGNATTTGALPTSLREYTVTGTQVGSDLPLTNLPSGRNVCCSYGENSEGAMELSDDGRYLMVTGYDVAPRDPGFDIFITPRVVGRVGVSDSTVTLSNTYVPDFGDGTRGIWSPDGDQFFVCGGDMGLLSGTFNTAPVQVLPSLVSSRHVHKVNGLWYYLGSNAGPSGTNGIATWDGANQVPIITTPNGASGRNFQFVDANTLYLCTSTGAQGLMKLVKDQFGVWNLAYQLPGTGVVSLGVSGTTIYVTSSNGGSILKTTDTGSGFTAYETIATAQPNTRFRGMVLLPQTSTTETLAPTGEQVLLGSQNSGGNLASWAADDNDARQICKFFVPNATSPFVRVNLNYTTTKASPTAVSFDVKVSVHTPGPQSITLNMQNKVTTAFVVTSVNGAASINGTTYNGVPTGNLADYVGGGGAMTGQIEIRQTGPSTLLLPCSSFEFAQMKVTG